MANTTNQGWTKPTVGGSEDTWGTTINAAIDAIDTLVGSVTAAEVAVLDGLTATTAELNYVDGVTSAIQPQIDTLTSSVSAVAGVPSGAIILWSGAANAIPSGYVLCDGNNSTPNLRNRFVVGAGDTYAVDATGGSADSTLPSHTHTASVTDGGHSHKLFKSGEVAVSATVNVGASSSVAAETTGASDFAYTIRAGSGSADIGQSSTATTNISVSNSTEGSSGTNANLPPYYALCYIMKT